MNYQAAVEKYSEYIAAALLAIVFLSELYTRWDYLETYDLTDVVEITNLVQMILSGLGTFILLFTKHKGPVKVLVICATIFSLIFMGRAYTDLVTLSEFLDHDIVNFVEGTIMIALSLMLLINTILYATRVSTNLTAMFFGTLGVILLSVMEALDYIRYGLYLDTILKFTLTTTIPLVLLAVFLLIIMKSKEVKTNTVLYNIKDSFSDVRKISPIGACIDRSGLSALQAVASDGTNGNDCEIKLNSYYPVRYKLQMTENDGRTSVSFVSEDDVSRISSFRLLLKGIWTDTGDIGSCDLVRIYGKDGFFIQLIVKDDGDAIAKNCSESDHSDEI